ncbi:MAG: ribonuclease HII [Opitutales bacterium]|jgi:ribonuclease HII
MKLWNHDCRAVQGFTGLVGVDEAGRGCLAGPVVAAAVWLEAGFYSDKRRRRDCRGIDDSKKLTAEERERGYAVIAGWRAEGLARVAVESASVEEIAAHNILGATRLAMARCLRVLAALGGGLPTEEEDAPLFAKDGVTAPRARILVDGRKLRPFAWVHEGVVGGDGKCLAIAAASIVAKVTRDRRMRELEGEFPGYGLARHKGYATDEHCDAIRRQGPCREHRALFLRKIKSGGNAAKAQAELGW